MIKNNGWVPPDKDPSTGEVINASAPNSLFYNSNSDSSFKVTGCKFENNGDEEEDLTNTADRHFDLFDIGDGKLVITDSSFENNKLNNIISAYYGTFEVENSSFINNRSRLFNSVVDSGYFSECTFSGNNIKGENGVFVRYLKPSNGIKFSNCEFVDNPLTDERYEKSEILDDTTSTQYADVSRFGSIFGEGSLTMIIALLALIASAVSIFLTVYYNKKKTAPVASDSKEAKDEE